MLERQDDLSKWLKKLERANQAKKISAQLYNQMINFIDDALKMDYNMIIEEFVFYRQLPSYRQNELIRYLFRDFRRNFSHFFDSCEQGFVNECIVNMFVRRYPIRHNLANRGKKMGNLFFIIEG